MRKSAKILLFAFIVIGILLFGCAGGAAKSKIKSTSKGTCEGSGADRCKSNTTREYEAKCVSKKWVYKSETCANGCEGGQCLSSPECKGVDDGNPCTQDVCSEATNYTVQHTALNGSQGVCTGSAGTCATNSCVAGLCQKVSTQNCCGNSKCESGETRDTCQADCKGTQALNTEEISELKTLLAGFDATRNRANENACKTLIGSPGGCLTESECKSKCEAKTECNGAIDAPEAGGTLLRTAVVQFGLNTTNLDLDYEAAVSKLNTWSSASTESNLQELKTRLTRMVSTANTIDTSKLQFHGVIADCYDKASNPQGDYCFCTKEFNSIDSAQLSTALAKVDLYLNRTGS